MIVNSYRIIYVRLLNNIVYTQLPNVWVFINLLPYYYYYITRMVRPVGYGRGAQCYRNFRLKIV